MASRSTKWFVAYKIPLFPKDTQHIADPYNSVFEAKVHAMDIKDYDGVGDVRVYEEDPDYLLNSHLDSEIK